MDTEQFLKDIDPASPSGDEVRYDPRFAEIGRLIEPASREGRKGGDGTFNMTPQVDWQEVLSVAADLAGTGRDLRLLVVVVRAMANAEGHAGLAAGLDLVTRTIDGWWDTLHPTLRDRPDPGEAALPRMNALRQMENTDEGLLGDLTMGAVLTQRGIGPISGADFARAGLSEFEFLTEAPGGMSDKEKAALLAEQEARINRVTAACRALAAEEPERAMALLAEVTAADAARAALEAKFNEKAGFAPGLGLKLAALGKHLARIRKTLEAFGAVARAPAEDAGTDAEPDAGAAPAGAAPAAAAPRSGLSGTITSRAEVERALDMIISFYESAEPSSPIPPLARRLRRMVPMSFVQLMEELAPSGVKEFQALSGTDDK